MIEPTRDLDEQALNRLLLDTNPYLSCDDCFAHIDEYVEARVANPTHSDERMEVHLSGCPACAEEAATLLSLLR